MVGGAYSLWKTSSFSARVSKLSASRCCIQRYVPDWSRTSYAVRGKTTPFIKTFSKVTASSYTAWKSTARPSLFRHYTTQVWQLVWSVSVIWCRGGNSGKTEQNIGGHLFFVVISNVCVLHTQPVKPARHWDRQKGETNRREESRGRVRGDAGESENQPALTLRQSIRPLLSLFPKGWPR